jgi:hypothetical protein
MWDNAAAPRQALHAAPKSRSWPAFKSVLSTTKQMKIECVHLPSLEVEESCRSRSEQIKKKVWHLSMLEAGQ